MWFPISLISLQNDPKYWNDPAKFEPERFSPENKQNIIPGTFFPFGMGPRECLGKRIAYLEAQVLLYHVLKNFKLEIDASKTPVPEIWDKHNVMRLRDGTWLKATIR